MPIGISVNEGGNIVIESHPNHCPICHSKITPIQKYGKIGTFFYKSHAEIVYVCPNVQCNEFFIAYFAQQPNNAYLSLMSTRPIEPVPLTFEESIREISPTFCDIYEEAHKAEQLGLAQICGVGYRKSFEFLIKDYIIRNRPADKPTIEAIMLGPCIETYVTDARIKEVAKRATWLGNDETHYQRRWITKDLNDLKTMIRFAVHWIEAEHLTEEALNSMPVPVKP